MNKEGMQKTDKEKIEIGLKSLRNIKAKIAIEGVKRINDRIKNREALTREDYRELKEYESDLKTCLAEMIEKGEK